SLLMLCMDSVWTLVDYMSFAPSGSQWVPAFLAMLRLRHSQPDLSRPIRLHWTLRQHFLVCCAYLLGCAAVTPNLAVLAGKRQQMIKLMFMTLVPVLALTIITVLSMCNQSNAMRTKIRDMIRFSMETGTVIHFLQRERDMTALHLTRCRDERLFLRERYPATDTALDKLSMWPREVVDGNSLSQFGSVKDFQKSPRMATSGARWSPTQLLIISKEDMGVERTLGGVFFAQGQFDTFTDYLWYQEKHTVGVGNFAASKRFSELVGVVFEEERDKASSNFSVSIDQMRQQISRNNASWVSLEMSTWWFDNMTVFIDIMFQVQLRL
uniref:PBPe domain-containing protein n=1 Tax=Macrostomum lignano TaxID=282301 RepID=A0A1I8FQW1_9PLAT